MSTHGAGSSDQKSSRSLKSALSKARLVQAERNDAVADLRAAEKARLDMLADEVAPVFQELPDGYDFEGVVSAGTRPRLWIDMLSFVAMAEDKRTYRFMKDTRLGRDLIFESEDVSQTADKITEYLAHRVLERDRALEANDSHTPKEKTAISSSSQEHVAESKKTSAQNDITYKKRVDEFGDEIVDESPEEDRFDEEVVGHSGPEEIVPVRQGFSLGALILSFLLGAIACFGYFAASGLGYINF